MRTRVKFKISLSNPMGGKILKPTMSGEYRQWIGEVGKKAFFKCGGAK